MAGLEMNEWAGGRVVVPVEIGALILGEVEKDVAGEEEEEIRQFYGEIVLDQRQSEARFLQWYREQINNLRALYLGSGSDVLPKYIWGEDRVVHLSLEDYLVDEETGERDKKYFEELGSGKRVIGRAIESPFARRSFNTVLIQDLMQKDIVGLVEEVFWLLEEEGKVILSNMVLSSDEFGGLLQSMRGSSGFVEVEIPDELQSKGVSESRFYVFKKVRLV